MKTGKPADAASAPTGTSSLPQSEPDVDLTEVEQEALTAAERVVEAEETAELLSEHNAQVAARRAQEAEQEAVELADTAGKLAEEVEDEELGKVRRCPKCRERMIKHDNPANPFTYGCWHCNTCGICWRGNQPR
jgi:hypothetical protein